MNEQESQLLNLLRSVMEADQVALAQAKQSVAVIDAEIAQLNKRHEKALGPFEDAASQILAAKHCVLLKGKIRDTSIRLAAAMAELGTADSALRSSFGRYNAFKMYLEEQYS